MEDVGKADEVGVEGPGRDDLVDAPGAWPEQELSRTNTATAVTNRGDREYAQITSHQSSGGDRAGLGPNRVDPRRRHVNAPATTRMSRVADSAGWRSGGRPDSVRPTTQGRTTRRLPRPGDARPRRKCALVDE